MSLVLGAAIISGAALTSVSFAACLCMAGAVDFCLSFFCLLLTFRVGSAKSLALFPGVSMESSFCSLLVGSVEAIAGGLG